MSIIKNSKENKKILKLILIVLLLVPMFVQLVFSSLPIFQRFVFILYSLIFILLGFGSSYFVLKFQVSLKILSTKMLNKICNFFMVVFIIVFLFQMSTTLGYVNTSDEAITIAFNYTALGLIIGINKIKTKYTMSDL